MAEARRATESHLIISGPVRAAAGVPGPTVPNQPPRALILHPATRRRQSPHNSCVGVTLRLGSEHLLMA
jgi:hypothetical protein